MNTPIKHQAYFLISLVCFLLFSCKNKPKSTLIAKNTKTTVLEQFYLAHIDSTITAIKAVQPNDNTPNITAYKKARKHFKTIEALFAYVETGRYTSLNQPNLPKIIDQTKSDVKILAPIGFQVVEELLAEPKPDIKALKKETTIIANSLQFVRENTDLKHLKPYHILWLIKEQLVRVTTLGLSGYDSPVLEASLQESSYSYNGIAYVLKTYQDHFKDQNIYTKWQEHIKSSQKALKANFESFNRYAFIKKYSKDYLSLWNATVQDWQIHFPFTLAITNDATSLFSKETFNISFFSDKLGRTTSPKVVTLGKTLFNDTSLSLDNKISCASCHQKDLYFTDGKKISDGVTRNSPSLFYAALQKSFFYDNRSGSLEGQIINVVNNKNEFHSNMQALTKKVKQNKAYQKEFTSLYSDSVTNYNIRHAMASYIRDLIPFSSKFDSNISGQENTLTKQEIHGFNLFMGKAKCATCHFPPVFNGTIPPKFKETEMEVIGVPKTAVIKNAVIDPDLGRYYFLEVDARKHYFKTPTVRNIAKTAPYMHNGVYTNLEQLLTFYNLGGGSGIGITLENQTLPTDPLGLDKTELKALEAFLQTLTDTLE